jgi:phosphoglycerate dehydrogenase-like enzyme
MTQISVPRTAAQSSVLLVMPMQDPGGEEILEQKCGRILRTGIDPSEIAEAISEVDTLIVRGPGYISAQAIEQATSLRFISVSGAGYDCVDIDAATERGLPVLFYPGFSALPVAEYVIGALVICSRRLGTVDRECRSFDFDWSRRTTDLMGNLLSGSTLGLVGLGRIGRIVATLATGLGMTVVAYDPLATDWPASIQQASTLEAVLTASDYVSVNTPLTEQTRGMLSRDLINSMKPGACLVNAARGEVLDERAVAEALASGHLAYGVFDVFETEPAVWGSPLAWAPNCMVTPHISGNSAATTRATCVSIAETVVQALNGDMSSAHLVNPTVLEHR